MARKHHKPEEIVAKLRQVEVLVGQDKPVADAVRTIGVTEATYYRWRSEFGGLKLDQVKRLKVLEQENGRRCTLERAPHTIEGSRCSLRRLCC
jgi:putative transposase